MVVELEYFDLVDDSLFKVAIKGSSLVFLKARLGNKRTILTFEAFICENFVVDKAMRIFPRELEL